MNAAQDDWTQIVGYMRADPRELGARRDQAGRFVQRVSCALDEMGAQVRRAWGLNAHEWQAVMVLWESGRMTMSQLGDRIPLSRAAVTTLADRLEAMGLVQRGADPKNRRKTMLSVTPVVEDELSQHQAGWYDMVADYAQGIDAATWAAFVEVATGIRNLAHEHADDLRSRLPVTLDTRGVGQLATRPRSDTGSEPTWW